MKKWETASMIILLALIIMCAVIGIKDSIEEQRAWEKQQAIAHSCYDLPVYYKGAD